MEILVIGVVSAINLIFIMKKLDLKRYEDAIVDIALFLFVLFIFAGTYSGMAVGMVASMIISIYLYINPPTFFSGKLKSNKAKAIWHNIKTLNPDGPTAPNKYDKL